LHDQIQAHKADLLDLFARTQIRSLIKEDESDFIKTISAA